MFKNLKPLAPYFRRYKWSYILGAVSVLLHNGIWILFPLIIRRAVDDLYAGVTQHKVITYAALLVAVAVVLNAGWPDNMASVSAPTKPL